MTKFYSPPTDVAPLALSLADAAKCRIPICVELGICIDESSEEELSSALEAYKARVVEEALNLRTQEADEEENLNYEQAMLYLLEVSATLVGVGKLALDLHSRVVELEAHARAVNALVDQTPRPTQNATAVPWYLEYL